MRLEAVSKIHKISPPKKVPAAEAKVPAAGTFCVFYVRR